MITNYKLHNVPLTILILSESPELPAACLMHTHMMSTFLACEEKPCATLELALCL